MAVGCECDPVDVGIVGREEPDLSGCEIELGTSGKLAALVGDQEDALAIGREDCLLIDHSWLVRSEVLHRAGSKVNQ
jgi:hypothetical protein